MNQELKLSREEVQVLLEAVRVMAAVSGARDEIATQYDAKRMEMKLLGLVVRSEYE